MQAWLRSLPSPYAQYTEFHGVDGDWLSHHLLQKSPAELDQALTDYFHIDSALHRNFITFQLRKAETGDGSSMLCFDELEQKNTALVTTADMQTATPLTALQTGATVAQTKLPPRISNLNKVCAHFTPREGISKQISDAFADAAERGIAFPEVALMGIAGSGKSEIAKHFALAHSAW